MNAAAVRTRVRAETSLTFRALGVRNFRLFFIGQLVSQAGTWMQLVALAWVVLQMTGDGFALGLATAAQFAPVLVFGAWGGVIADRVDRHRFMLVTQTAFTVVAGGFAVLILTDRLTLPAIYALSAAFGFITALDNPTRRSLVVELVEPDDVPNAVGLNSALMTGSRVVGPAVAGALISTVGVEWCFVLNAVSYLAVIGALAAMDRGAIRSAPPVPRARRQLREGLAYVWRTPELRAALLLLAVIGTLAFEFQVSLPLLAERALGGSAATFSLLYSTMSAGSLAGALIIARRRDVDTRFLARAGIGLGIAMAALAVAPGVGWAVAAAVPVGVTSIFLISGANAVIQLRADAAMRGRALALTAVVFIGSTPVGGPVVGWVGEHLGPRWGVGLGAVASLVAGLLTLRALGRAASSPPPGATGAVRSAPAVVRS